MMKIPVLLCLVILNLSVSTAASGGHGYFKIQRYGRVIGGHDASPRSHPYLVALQIRLLWARMRLCSGSLLSERWILTAGHCVKGSWLLNWLTMEAVVGTSDLEHKDYTAQTVRILERIPHPNYDGDVGPYDIAMLKTAKRIVYSDAVSPIEVPLFMGSLTDKNKNLMLAGWGVLKTTLFIPALSDKLQEAQVEYLPFDECIKAIDAVKEPYEDNPLDRLANICSGPITGGVAACSGDSGGPLIQYISKNYEIETTTLTTHLTSEETDNETTDWSDANEVEDTTENKERSTIEKVKKEKSAVSEKENYRNEDLIPVVIGVVSWGISPCGEVGAPTVYTNVSTYADFIYDNISN